MKSDKLLATISRNYFQKKHVLRYRMKKIEDMSDFDVIKFCHWYCEENLQTNEFELYRTKMESEYRYCPYIQEFVEDGLCYDIQMITNGYIKSSVLPEYYFDYAKAKSACDECHYKM